MAAIEACDIQGGHTVLDIGCGSGQTTIEIARRVGAEGRVIGMDISTPMLEVGRARIKTLGITGMTFENRDVATYSFEAETFDRLFSRFGVMFFIDPVAAFTNIRRGLKTGGRLGFVCWQALSENPWFEIPTTIALQHVPAPPKAKPGAPERMAFADPDHVRSILSSAGFRDINLEPLKSILLVGHDVPSAVEKLIQSGPAGRLLSKASEEIKARVADDLGRAIAGYQTDDGLKMGCTAWIVTAG